MPARGGVRSDSANRGSHGLVTIDFCRVERFEQDRLLGLVAEMKVPGRAWLQFEVQPHNKGGSVIRQTAIFDPAGVPGLAYWYRLWPLHSYIFGGMLQRIAVTAVGSGG